MDDLDFVKACLNASKLTPEQIAAETGLKPRWVRYVKDGFIRSPGYPKVRLLADYFERTRRVEHSL